jgi:hypothetical protein
VKRAIEAARALAGEQLGAMGIRAPQTKRKRQEAAQAATVPSPPAPSLELGAGVLTA